MKTFYIALLAIFLIPSSLMAQESVDTAQVQQLEEQRLEEIQNELHLSIPDYTDNPSHIVTFVDPSEEKVGVELDVDESGFKEITSPYSFPSLNIGEHHLKFRFTDSLGAVKLLEYDIVIIPRPPLVKAPVFNENILNISGTGLANSQVMISMSVNATNFTDIVEIDSDGNWSTSIELETAINGIYTIFAYTRKDGYSSNPSEPAVLAYGDDGATTLSDYKDQDNSISFAFSNIQLNQISSMLSLNPDLIVLSIGSLLLGALISAILLSIIRRGREEGINKEFSKKLKKEKDDCKEKTLMELFAEKEVKEKKTETPKDEIPKDEKSSIFTKKDFLKDFQNFDPDSKVGKENKEPNKKNKKDVVISLTSKVEE